MTPSIGKDYRMSVRAQGMVYKLRLRGIFSKHPKLGLPGLSLGEAFYAEENNLGVFVVGIIPDSEGYRDFYEGWDNEEISHESYGNPRVQKLASTSNIFKDEGFEELFYREVRKELKERVEECGRTNLVVLGIGSGEEVRGIFSKAPELRKSVRVYGVDAFEGMLRQSLWIKEAGYDYRPVKGDMRELDRLNVPLDNAVLTLNANTKGNLRREDRVSIDERFAAAKGDATFYQSVYYPPADDTQKLLSAFKYARMHCLAPAVEFDERERTLQEVLTKPLVAYCVYNDCTQNIELWNVGWDERKNRPVPTLKFRSHRFSKEELRGSAKRAGLEIRLKKDEKYGMFVVRLT